MGCDPVAVDLWALFRGRRIAVLAKSRGATPPGLYDLLLCRCVANPVPRWSGWLVSFFWRRLSGVGEVLDVSRLDNAHDVIAASGANASTRAQSSLASLAWYSSGSDASVNRCPSPG
jgi:hypothetical protein